MSQESNPAPQSEWSHFVDVSPLDAKPLEISIEAPPESCPAICNRLNLHSIESLRAKIILKRNDVNRYVFISGEIDADLHQRCVVTTEPVTEHVSDTFEAWYAEANQAVSFAKAKRERMSVKERDEQPVLEEEEDPEEIIDGKIDVGELIIQNLSLALNPYPRLEGVEFEGQQKGLDDAPDGTYDNPFAALKNWKHREPSED